LIRLRNILCDSEGRAIEADKISFYYSQFLCGTIWNEIP
jgi:hypothetical protein